MKFKAPEYALIGLVTIAAVVAYVVYLVGAMP